MTDRFVGVPGPSGCGLGLAGDIAAPRRDLRGDEQLQNMYITGVKIHMVHATSLSFALDPFCIVFVIQGQGRLKLGPVEYGPSP